VTSAARTAREMRTIEGQSRNRGYLIVNREPVHTCERDILYSLNNMKNQDRTAKPVNPKPTVTMIELVRSVSKSPKANKSKATRKPASRALLSTTCALKRLVSSVPLWQFRPNKNGGRFSELRIRIGVHSSVEYPKIRRFTPRASHLPVSEY
jgi:hypothetical protein